MIEMLPSNVVLHAIPLIGTLGRAEREAAAALLVRACQRHGDRWQAISPRMIGESLKADLEERVEPWVSLNTNPFFRPDFQDLVEAGFAQGEIAAHGPLALTEKALRAIRRRYFVVPSRECIKCGGTSPCVYRYDPPEPKPGGPPADADPFLRTFIDGELFDAVLWACPAHGEFACRANGEQVFAEPDTWVAGPNGERLFRDFRSASAGGSRR